MATDSRPRRTAFITGASSGIGAALAERFAQSDFNLILLGRDEVRLAAVANVCRQSGIQVQTFGVDLADDEALHKFIKHLESADWSIDAVVNNAGSTQFGPVSETSWEVEQPLVKTQVLAPIRLIQSLLPHLRRQPEGYILNIASVYAFTPVAYQAAYGASKSFLLSYSFALAHELKDTRVSVTVVCPGVTRTAFRHHAGIHDTGRMRGMSPIEVADIAFRGMMQRKLLVVPGTINKIFIGCLQCLPIRWHAALVQSVNRFRGLKS